MGFAGCASLTAQAATYYIDCGSSVVAATGSMESPLQSVAAVNALRLSAGDSVLFKRGSACKGELQPSGSGRRDATLSLGSYGSGDMPRIEAEPGNDAALRFFNQEFWDIHSLELRGGATYGVFISGDHGTLHHFHLRDLRVHDVRGKLQHKESGLVVIKSANEQQRFDDVDVDGVMAWNTTQWSGIFVADASHVQVRNSMVHDVQGDGIVVFSSNNAVIERSVAWHTGMQHQQSIGTPNAIWTWRCSDCVVTNNEAFLTDSPGIDGGAFDIDFWNTNNRVLSNFGHDTAGYCVSAFGAFRPTTMSTIADNLCLHNGLSPRLAQRQGAILLMTWQGGSITGLEIKNNRIDWEPPGDTPAIQIGAGLKASEVSIRGNEVWSNGISYVNPALNYAGSDNRYLLEYANQNDLVEAQKRLAALPEQDSSVAIAPVSKADHAAFGQRLTDERGWRLVVWVPQSMLVGDVPRGTLVELKSAALQFGRAGLQVSVESDGDVATLTGDWQLERDGVEVKHIASVTAYSMKLISPEGKVVREWREYAGPVDLGLLLRQTVGPPVYGRLAMENMEAVD
jgi:hypothetical protein